MITSITKTELAEYFGNTTKTLNLWNKSSKKSIRERYEAFEQRLLMVKNGFSNMLDLIEENERLKTENQVLKDELQDMEVEVNKYVDKMESLQSSALKLKGTLK